MKSEKAKEFIDGCMNHLTVEMTDHAKWQLRAAMTHAAELAERRMRGTAIAAFCAANCSKRCSFGTGGSIGCGAKYRFIQELNAYENV